LHFMVYRGKMCNTHISSIERIGAVNKVFVYDTTLRDGSQMEGVSFSTPDRLEIVKYLDSLGVDFIEGGFPQSNPKDREFFKEIRKIDLHHSKIVAFGSSRKKGKKVEEDPIIGALLAAKVPAVALVCKSWDMHVREVLKTSLDENLRMISDSVAYCKKKRKIVIFDSEHFFDGYKANPEYAMKTIAAAVEAGAHHIALCDTNGGCLPYEIEEITAKVVKAAGSNSIIGIHCHNDSGCAEGNTVSAVKAGARHVQGTFNGFGERTGNADLCVVVPNIVIKMGKSALKKGALKRLTEVSRAICELANITPTRSQPYVGASAFSHKGGMHVHAIAQNSATYEHIKPELVGNERRILLSELSGQATILKKFETLKISTDKEARKVILNKLQDMEAEGYQFEAAEASFELLVRSVIGGRKKYFDLESFRVIVERRQSDSEPITEATIKLRVGKKFMHMASEGDGPVDAINGALRGALEAIYPTLKQMHLSDYKVRVINPRAETAARVLVNITTRDKKSSWSTVGVSENIIEASYQALVDSIEYKLSKDGIPGR